jgi:hypothetical protein
VGRTLDFARALSCATAAASSAGAPNCSRRPPNAIPQTANQLHPRRRPAITPESPARSTLLLPRGRLHGPTTLVTPAPARLDGRSGHGSAAHNRSSGGVLVVPAALSLVQVGYRGMMVEIFAVAFAVALVVGTVAIAVDLSSMSIPALRNWLDLRGSELAELHRVLTLAFGGSRPRPAPPSGRPAASARPRRRNRSRPRVNHPARTAAQRERTEAAVELAKQEAALAQRERLLERSLADAERSAA